VKQADVDRLGATIRIIGKGGTYREVPLRPGVVDLIQQYVTQERNGQPFAASDYLLISQRAPKLHRDAVRRLVGAIGQQLGMTLYPHKFRHTFATRLLEKGVALTTVSKLCGHSRVDTSARYYVSTSRQQKKDAVTLL
jgi:site-specific recombinase XerD